MNQLERNTYWWDKLSELGVEFDPNCFGGLQLNHGMTGPRIDSHLRELVPRILKKSNLDLSLALEFCQQVRLTFRGLASEIVLKLNVSGLSSSSEQYPLVPNRRIFGCIALYRARAIV